MRCEDASDRFFDVARDDLVTKDPQVLAHLERCPDCSAAVTRATGAWSLLIAIPEADVASMAMRERFDAFLRDHARRRASWHRRWRPREAAAALILMLGSGVLVGRQFHGGGQKANSASAMHRELGELREMLSRALMHREVASERIRGVGVAARIEDPRAALLTEVVDTLLHDPDVNVRLAALRALERFWNRPTVRQGVVRALGREESPLVTIALIDFVVAAKETLAIDTLRQLARDTARDAGIRQTAAEGAERLLDGGGGV